MNPQNLVTVTTYSKLIKKSRIRVYQMINEGKLDCIVIDGVIFIETI